jgi:hypothetical protein
LTGWDRSISFSDVGSEGSGDGLGVAVVEGLADPLEEEAAGVPEPLALDPELVRSTDGSQRTAASPATTTTTAIRIGSTTRPVRRRGRWAPLR